MDPELKQYLDERFQAFDNKLATFATKDDLTQQLAEQTATLKAYADEQTEKLAVIINNTVVEPTEKSFAELKDYKTVQEKVLNLETDMQKIKSALQLN